MTTDPHDSAGDDADLWLNLKFRLSAGRDAIRPDPDQYCYKVTSRDFDAAELHWIANCKAHKEQATRIIESWIETGTFPDADATVRFFVASRFDAAQDLLTMLCHSENQQWKSIFPFPKMNMSDVLHYLLIGWWEGIGQFYFFRQRFYGA